MKNEITLELDAQYSQFYVQDENAESNTGDIWSKEASMMNLAVAPGMIGVGTAGSYIVPVTIRVLETEPTLQPVENEDISQINECDLVVSSGKIVIGGTMDYFPEAKRLELANGTFRVRIYYFNLDSISKDELSGNDHYEVELWPTSKEEGIKVIK